MAFTSRVIDAPARAAFAAIVDPTTYEDWLVGAKAIRDVDDGWPRPGSRFHHRVGVGPIRIPDSTEALAVEDGSMLRLRVRARPFISAVAEFRIVPSGDRCVVTLQEEPRLGRIDAVLRPLLDPSIHLRNHRSLRNLARFLGDGDAHDDD